MFKIIMAKIPDFSNSCPQGSAAAGDGGFFGST
jgi:hypothetical protein